MQASPVPASDRPLLLTGPLLWPRRDLASASLEPVGAVLIDADGSLVAVGREQDVSAHILAASARREHARGVLAPAFADLHLHWVHHHVAGKHREPLLSWLSDRIWPAEAELCQPDAHLARERRAKEFWEAMLRCGTLATACYASSAESTVDAALAHARGLHVCGDAIMTTGCEPPLRRDEAATLDGLSRLGQRYGAAYAVTPRFALNADDEVLLAAGNFARQHDHVIQTHLAENLDEVAAVRRAFPGSASYAAVYDDAGLLSPRSIIAHCIHLSEAEWRLLAERRCVVAHCPSSNLALSSGRMVLGAATALGVDWMLASDIGAGPDPCMFDVTREFLRVHHGVEPVSPSMAFAHATVCAIPSRLLYPQSRVDLGANRAGAPTVACLVELDDSDLPATGDGAADHYLAGLVARYDGVAESLVFGVRYGTATLR